MKTIERVLGYKPYSEAFLARERMSGNFNGMGTDEVNLDGILRETIITSFKYNPDKGKELYIDLQNLFYRHDQEYKIKSGKLCADFKLAHGIFSLLHWTKLRWFIAPSIFITLSFSREAKRTYRELNTTH